MSSDTKSLAEMFAEDIVSLGVAAAEVMKFLCVAQNVDYYTVVELLCAAGYGDDAVASYDPLGINIARRYYDLRNGTVSNAAGKRVVVVDYSQGTERWLPDLRVVALVTDDSVDKIQRRLAAAAVVEECLNKP